MDQEQIDQQQISDDFNAGFNSVRPSDDYVPPEVKESTEQQAEPGAPEPEAQDPAPDAPNDEPRFAGFTEAEIKSLLERSTRVDSIEDQLRKAHGKIGELNGTLQELKAHQSKPTPSAPAVDPEQMTEFETNFPEFVAIADARAQRIAEQIMATQAPQGDPQPDIKVELQKEVQLGIMDAMYEDWRETVNTQDFKLWLTTQTPEVQHTYDVTWNARELGNIVTKFKDWQQTATDRASKSKQRLEGALLPDNKNSRVTHAPTAQDEFLAGFNSVRAQH